MHLARQQQIELNRLTPASDSSQRITGSAGRVSDTGFGEASRTDDDEIARSLHRWKRVLRSLQLRPDPEPACKWVRALAIQLAIESMERRGVTPEEAEELAVLRQAAQKLLDAGQSAIDKPLMDEIEAWLELRRDRDELERQLSAMADELRKTFEERGRRRVREWFANDLPIPVLIGKPVPLVEGEADAREVLEGTEQAAAGAAAACLSRPPRAAEQTLGDWHWTATTDGASRRSLDPKVIDSEAEKARITLARVPSAGHEPLLTSLNDLLRLHPAILLIWRSLALVGTLGVPIVLAGFVMGSRTMDDLRPMLIVILAVWAVVLPTWTAKKLTDLLLRRRHLAWAARAAPRDEAYRAIAWQYLVRRAELEQLQAEALALRQFIAASVRLREFDADPELGGYLLALRERHPDLAPHVDAAAEDSTWAIQRASTRA